MRGGRLLRHGGRSEWLLHAGQRNGIVHSGDRGLPVRGSVARRNSCVAGRIARCERQHRLRRRLTPKDAIHADPSISPAHHVPVARQDQVQPAKFKRLSSETGTIGGKIASLLLRARECVGAPLDIPTAHNTTRASRLGDEVFAKHTPQREQTRSNSLVQLKLA
jgi:hypothetical protein